MAFELKQELKLTQGLVMTPQLQLAIKLLQLTRLELVDVVREEILTNPVLEETAEPGGQETDPAPEAPANGAEPEAPGGVQAEFDWQAFLEDRAGYAPRGVDFNAREEDDYISNIASSGGSLVGHLLAQLEVSGLGDRDREIAEFIIRNISEDGYLRIVEPAALNDDEAEYAALVEISTLTGATVEEADRVLGMVRQFDPPGVGSRSLRECLLTQARGLPIRDTLAERVIATELERLGRRNYRAVAKALGVTVEDVLGAASFISTNLNPTPGAGFGADEARAIVPDVYIHRVGDDYVISLNEDGMPKLRVSPYYRRLLKGGGPVAADAKGYIQNKLRSAVWLIKSVHQRQRTICRVVECIVKFQREFLDHGLEYLRPMVLKDVAAEIGVHESTVSRVTSNKYVQTPRGIFELKYFFSTGMSRSDGADVAVEYIKEKVREIIKGEDARNPLSDKQITEELRRYGIEVARRTASKYREALGILSSSRRKVHY